MDPTATLTDILQAVLDDDLSEALCLMRELRLWIENGGFCDPAIKIAFGKLAFN